MLAPLLLWHKIGRISLILSRRLDITPLRALDVFYTSSVCDRIHNPEEQLYIFSDEYIADEVCIELRKQHGES